MSSVLCSEPNTFCYMPVLDSHLDTATLAVALFVMLQQSYKVTTVSGGKRNELYLFAITVETI